MKHRILSYQYSLNNNFRYCVVELIHDFKCPLKCYFSRIILIGSMTIHLSFLQLIFAKFTNTDPLEC